MQISSDIDAPCLFTRAVGGPGATLTLEIEIATTTHAMSMKNEGKMVVKMMHLAYSPGRWEAQGQPKHWKSKLPPPHMPCRGKINAK